MRRLGFVLVACAACATGELPAPRAESAEAVCPQKRTDVGGADASAVLGKSVVKVCVVGGDAQLGAIMTGGEGAPLAAEWVNDRLAELFKTGQVRDAEVIASPLDDERLVLTFFVTPYARLEKIGFDPSPDIEPGAFAAITPNAYGVASPRGLAALSEAVRAIYIEHGYPHATANAAVTRDEAVVTVERGPRDDIKAIRFSGIKRVSEAQLRAVMKSREGEVYSSDTVLRDQLYIQAHYLDHGMLRIAVTPTYTDGALVIAVDEGDVFRVSSATLSGTPLRDTKSLTKMFETKRGSVFSRTAAMHDIDLIRSRAADQGTPVSVLPSMKLDEKKKTVALTFELEPASP